MYCIFINCSSNEYLYCFEGSYKQWYNCLYEDIVMKNCYKDIVVTWYVKGGHLKVNYQVKSYAYLKLWCLEPQRKKVL